MDAPPVDADAETTKTWYESLAAQIEREDNLVSQRLGWMMTLEGLLFAAFGAAASGKTGVLDPVLNALLRTACVAGILVAALAWMGVEDARAAAQDLKDVYIEWRKKFLKLCKPPPTAPYLVRPFGSRGATRGSVYVNPLNLLDTARGLPFLLILSWTYLAIKSWNLP